MACMTLLPFQAPNRQEGTWYHAAPEWGSRYRTGLWWASNSVLSSLAVRELWPAFQALNRPGGEGSGSQHFNRQGWGICFSLMTDDSRVMSSGGMKAFTALIEIGLFLYYFVSIFMSTAAFHLNLQVAHLQSSSLVFIKPT